MVRECGVAITTDCVKNEGSNHLLSTALGYAQRGYPVFPCIPFGKSPMSPHGHKDATVDEQVIRDWWTRTPNANLGLPTGKGSFDVVDIDFRPEGDGFKALERLKRAGLLRGSVRIVKTPSGGLHIWFPGTEQRCSSLKGLYVDFKASGGYVLVPPSFIITDAYEGSYVEIDSREEGIPFNWNAAQSLLLPSTTRSFSKERSHFCTGKIAPLARWLQKRPEGSRNSSLFWAACKALQEGHKDLEILIEAAMIAGLSYSESERTVQSAQNYIGGIR